MVRKIYAIPNRIIYCMVYRAKYKKCRDDIAYTIQQDKEGIVAGSFCLRNNWKGLIKKERMS